MIDTNVPYGSPCSKVPIVSTGIVTRAENARFREGILPVIVRQLLQTVWTPTLCIPDTSDRPGYFLISLSNLATPLFTYGAPCITLLCSTFIATLLHI